MSAYFLLWLHPSFRQVRRLQMEGASSSSIAHAVATSLAAHEPNVVIMDGLQVRR